MEDTSISDILATLQPTLDTSATSLSAPSSAKQSDISALTRAWVAERTSPELQPYPAALMERVQTRLRAQIDALETQTGSMDPRTNFGVIIAQTELERVKFLLRSFLRSRIAKVDRYPLHIIKTQPERLAPPETQYLRHHHSLLLSHYLSSFLDSFPAQLRGLEDTAGGISMIETPDLDSAVFCRVLRDTGQVDVPGTDTVLELRRGAVHVVRYSAIRDALIRGDVELI